jgi:hypothetical protein
MNMKGKLFGILAVLAIATLLLGSVGAQNGKRTDERPIVKVFIPREVSLAVVGNTCTSGNCCTFGDITVEKDWDFKAVVPRNAEGWDEVYYTTVGHNDFEVQEIKDEWKQVVKSIREETGGALNLKVQFVELYGEAGMGGLGKFNYCGLISGPQADGMAELLDRHLTPETDFLVYAHTGFSMGWAGIAWWAGEIYSTPYAAVQAVNQGVYKHELTHGIDFAMHQVMYVEDIYAYGNPECGNYDENKFKWFPNPDQCTKDPDYTDCGAKACYSGPDNFYTHTYNEHYPPWVKLNGNYCLNKVKDFDEDGVDCGGEYCKPCLEG